MVERKHYYGLVLNSEDRRKLIRLKNQMKATTVSGTLRTLVKMAFEQTFGVAEDGPGITIIAAPKGEQ